MSEPANASGGVVERRRAIRSSQNFVAGLTLLAVAAIALFATADLGEGRFYAVGPALLPRAVATLLALVGAGLVAGGLMKEGDMLTRWSLRGPLFVFIALVAFALSIRTVGLAELLLFALLVTALSIGLFRFVLHLPIPILIIPRLLVL